MRTFLLVPGALVDEPDWDDAARALRTVDAGALAACLRRAPRRVRSFEARWSEGAAHLEWLAEAFQAAGDPPATAPYAWRDDASPGQPGDAEGEVWHCDPVHLDLKPERTVLAPIDGPPLRPHEVQSLLADAADAAREAGARIDLRAGRWFLRPSRPWRIRTLPLQSVLGASVQTRLPDGEDASQWRRLFNDIQMRWHAGAVHRAREERGEQAANALWLHGGGPWRPLPASRFAHLVGEDPVLQGWQRAARPSAGSGAQDVLHVWPELFEPYWRKDWSAWAHGWDRLQDHLLGRAQARPQRSIELVACGRRDAAAFALGAAWSRFFPARRSLHDCLVQAGA